MPSPGPARRVFRAAVAAAFACALGLAASAPARSAAPSGDLPAPRVRLTPEEPRVGEVAVVEVDCRPRGGLCPEGLRLRWSGQEIALFPHPGRGPAFRIGLLAVPLTANAAATALEALWSEAGRPVSRPVAFRIRAGLFAEEALRVDPRHVHPSPRDRERIRREREELERIYATGAPLPLWRGRFLVPVPGEVSGAFGTRRVFNGELISRHTGVDFRAAAGEPVVAAGSGVVRLAKELFYSGNAVVLDHGAGVFTSYSHLSRIEVGVGQRVDRGAGIGRVGATGRATGPHLHWGGKVNGVAVDPLALVAAMALLAPE